MARRLRLALLAAASSLCTCGASSSSSSSSSSWSSSSGSQQCGARDETALTSDCLGLCYDGRPCIAYASESAVVAGGGSEDDEEELTVCEATTFSACVNASRGGCALECFTNGPDDFVAHDAVGFSSYTFLVPFTGDAAVVEDGVAVQENDTDVLPSKTNAVLKRVEPLSLLSVTTKAAILGGSSVEYAVARGRTVEMHLADGFLAANTQLQEITLANLALRAISRGSLPTSSVTDLTLANCLLSTTYPRDLASMAALIRLDLSQNLFTDFPSSLSLPMLQELNLSSNELSSFRGDLPLLESLDLSENQLTSIPSSVFELPRLERLYLRANQFANLILSESQLAFLQDLSVLSTDSLGDVSHCLSSSSSSDDTLGSSAGTSLTLVRVHDVSVCALVSASSSSLDGSETSVTSIDEASPSSNTAIVAGSAIGGVVVLLALVAGLIMFVRRHGRRRRPHSKLTAALAEEALDAVLCPLPPAYTAESEKTVEHTLLSAHRLLEWRVDESDIHWMTDELTRGSRYVVDLAVFRHRFRHDGRFRRELFPGPIAVKRLRIDDRDDPRARDRLLTDAAVLSRVRHPQILSLLGVRYSRALGVQALVEFMEGGTLRAWLSGLLDAGESSAWTPIKAQLALDVADALAFAHSHAPPLVHARLRSDKVFLTGDARAKLGDWRAYEPSGSGGGDHDDGMGTVLLPRSGAQSGERWLAPEVLAGSAAHSPASDVFALGVLLSELDTHRPPYEGGGELIAHGGAVSVLVASGRLRPAFSAGVDGLPRALRAMAQRCLALDPRARPAAPEVVRAFRAAAEREA